MSNISLDSIAGSGFLTKTEVNKKIVINGKFTTANSTELHLLQQKNLRPISWPCNYRWSIKIHGAHC